MVGTVGVLVAVLFVLPVAVFVADTVAPSTTEQLAVDAVELKPLPASITIAVSFDGESSRVTLFLSSFRFGLRNQLVFVGAAGCCGGVSGAGGILSICSVMLTYLKLANVRNCMSDECQMTDVG